MRTDQELQQTVLLVFFLNPDYVREAERSVCKYISFIYGLLVCLVGSSG